MLRFNSSFKLFLNDFKKTSYFILVTLIKRLAIQMYFPARIDDKNRRKYTKIFFYKINEMRLSVF